METTEDEPIPLSCLPCEILLHIFSLLSLPDRRSVRLTCSKCYDVCAAFSIRNREKFVLRTEDDVTEFTDFVEKSQSRNVSAEFERIRDFATTPGPWRLSGENLHSLYFLDSRLSDSVMEDIITNCVNLVELQIGVSSHFNMAALDFHKVLFSRHAFDDAIRKKVQRTKLRVFSLVVDYAHVPSWLMRNVLHIYPRIEKFGIGSSAYSPLMRKSSFPRPSTYLKHFHKLESLIFNVLSTGGWIKKWNSQQSSQPRLERFEAILLYTDSLCEWLLKFFSIQTKLRVVVLTFIDCDDDGSVDSILKLMAQACDNCTDLREFTLLAK